MPSRGPGSGTLINKDFLGGPVPFAPPLFHAPMSFKSNVRLLLALVGAWVVLPVSAQPVSVYTQRYATDRLAWNRRERVLNTANVRPSGFGLQYYCPVDDQIYAQPLVVSDLLVQGAPHTVVLVATVNNTLYCFDADTALGAQAVPLWQRNLNRPGYRAIRNSDMTGACGGRYYDFSGNMGIVGTPVIDSASETMYLVHREILAGGGAGYAQWLHAIDIRTGAERPNSPVSISGSVPGTGDGSSGGRVSFSPQKNNQRAALLLHQGLVYVAWASHCDWGPYHGWLIGYDKNTLAQRVIYNSTPDGGDGGIWMSACGPTIGPEGDIYLTTGNGTVGVGSNPNNTRNRGESLLRLRNVNDTLKVVRFFTPSNYPYLEANDLDYGSDGVILIPDTRLALSGSKDGFVYMTHADSMAGYSATNRSVLQSFRANVQTRDNRHLHGTPIYHAYLDSAGVLKEYVYVWAESDSLKRLPFNRATQRFDLRAVEKGHVKLDDGMPGSMLSASSDGFAYGSGLIWCLHPLSGNANQQVRPGRLQAYDPRNITRPIYSTDMNPSRDLAGNFSKFNTPVVANGKVYLATFSNRLNVYGLLQPTSVRQPFGSKPFTISPVPALRTLTVEALSEAAYAPTQLVILDADGRTLHEETVNKYAVVSLERLPAGVYQVRFYQGGREVQAERFSKQ